jgi:hypothetical protein
MLPFAPFILAVNGGGHEETHRVRPGDRLELGPPSAQQTEHSTYNFLWLGWSRGEMVTY